MVSTMLQKLQLKLMWRTIWSRLVFRILCECLQIACYMSVLVWVSADGMLHECTCVSVCRLHVTCECTRVSVCRLHVTWLYLCECLQIVCYMSVLVWVSADCMLRECTCVSVCRLHVTWLYLCMCVSNYWYWQYAVYSAKLIHCDKKKLKSPDVAGIIKLWFVKIM
jgi:hypothetical protein